MINEKTETFFKYQIITYERDGKFVVSIYNTKAEKHPYVTGGYSKTEEGRAKYIADFKKRIEDREINKMNRALERKNFVNPAKIGDILYTSWGYEQTNIDFYEVVEVRGKQVVIRELAQETTQTAWLQGTCKPIPGKFLENVEPLRKLVQPGYQDAYMVNLTSYSSAWPWDGKEKHYTQYA